MRIARALLDDIVDHALRDAPHECCGVVAVDDGAAVAVHPAENLAASAFRFEMDGLAVFQLLESLEDSGHVLGAIYHSHTRSDPYPSQTDVNFSFGWPGVEWLIVGVPKKGEPEVRSYLINDGEVREVDVEVV